MPFVSCANAIAGISANTIAIRAVGGSHLTTNDPVGAGLAKNRVNNQQFWYKTRPYQCDRYHQYFAMNDRI